MCKLLVFVDFVYLILLKWQCCAKGVLTDSYFASGGFVGVYGKPVSCLPELKVCVF